MIGSGEGEGFAPVLRRSSVTCRVCGFTRPAENVRGQFKGRRGGAEDGRLLAVVTTRDRESGRRYHSSDVTPSGRPKYGALDVMHHPDGPVPRFGSCVFLLRPDVAKRSTFTFGGSHEDWAVDRTGTLDVMEPVLAPLLSQLERGAGAFRHRRFVGGGLSDADGTEFLNTFLRFRIPRPGTRTRQLYRASGPWRVAHSG